MQRYSHRLPYLASKVFADKLSYKCSMFMEDNVPHSYVNHIHICIICYVWQVCTCLLVQRCVHCSYRTVMGCSLQAFCTLLLCFPGSCSYTYVQAAILNLSHPLCAENDRKMIFTLIHLYRGVIENSRSSWLQTLGNQLINCSSHITHVRYTNRKYYLLYNTT